MDNNLFARHESLISKGIIVSVVAINQISNGYEEQVKDGNMPLITFTCEVMDEALEDMLFTMSCDSFEEALREGIEYAEHHIDDLVGKRRKEDENEAD